VVVIVKEVTSSCSLEIVNRKRLSGRFRSPRERGSKHDSRQIARVAAGSSRDPQGRQRLAVQLHSSAEDLHSLLYGIYKAAMTLCDMSSQEKKFAATIGRWTASLSMGSQALPFAQESQGFALKVGRESLSKFSARALLTLELDDKSCMDTPAVASTTQSL
jgi:hypothetical protein